MAVAGERNPLRRAFFKLLQARLRPEMRALGRGERRGHGQRGHGQRGVAENKTGAAKMLGEKVHSAVEFTKAG